MALQANPALAGFNAYATIAEANAYHATRLHNSAWTSATDPTKEAAIIWATRNFEVIEWKGWVTVADQLLQWPRSGVFKNGNEAYDASAAALYYNIILDPNTVPTFLKEATAEAAFWLVSSDVTAPTGSEGYRRMKVDVIELEIDKHDRLKWLNDAVKNIIWRYMRTSNKYTAKVQRT